METAKMPVRPVRRPPDRRIAALVAGIVLLVGVVVVAAVGLAVESLVPERPRDPEQRVFWKLADQDREAVSADQDFNQVTNGEVLQVDGPTAVVRYIVTLQDGFGGKEVGEVPFCYELDLKGSDPVEVACP